MKQIDEKGYLIPYQKDHREIIKIGVEFSGKLAISIVGW